MVLIQYFLSGFKGLINQLFRFWKAVLEEILPGEDALRPYRIRVIQPQDFDPGLQGFDQMWLR